MIPKSRRQVKKAVPAILGVVLGIAAHVSILAASDDTPAASPARASAPDKITLLQRSPMLQALQRSRVPGSALDTLFRPLDAPNLDSLVKASVPPPFFIGLKSTEPSHTDEPCPSDP